MTTRTVVNGVSVGSESTLSRIATGVLIVVIGAGIVGGIFMYGRQQSVLVRLDALERQDVKHEVDMHELRERLGLYDHRGETMPRGATR